MDLGANWIHGSGPGLTDGRSEPTFYKWGPYNPVYEIAVENGIESVPTWKDLESRKQVYYWWKGGKVDDEMLSKLEEQIDEMEDLFYDSRESMR